MGYTIYMPTCIFLIVRYAKENFTSVRIFLTNTMRLREIRIFWQAEMAMAEGLIFFTGKMCNTEKRNYTNEKQMHHLEATAYLFGAQKS